MGKFRCSIPLLPWGVRFVGWKHNSKAIGLCQMAVFFTGIVLFGLSEKLPSERRRSLLRFVGAPDDLVSAV